MYFYRVAKFIVNIVFRVIFRIEINGRDNVPEKGPIVLCSNHKSNLDPVILGIAFPRPIIFMAKQELFKNRFLSKLITALGAFPVDREGSDIGAIKTSFRVLKQEQVLGIFPEGTRVERMDLDNAKPGIALISIKSKSPIVPVYIDSEYKLFSEIVVNIGEPIYFDEYYNQKLEAEDYLEISKDIMRTIYSLKKL